VCRAFRFAIRIDSVSPKWEGPIRLYWLLASVYQTTDRRIIAADTTVMITTHERASSLISGAPIFCEGARRTRPQPGSPLPPTAWVTAMCIDSNRFSGVKRIESNLFLANRNALVLRERYVTVFSVYQYVCVCRKNVSKVIGGGAWPKNKDKFCASDNLLVWWI